MAFDAFAQCGARTVGGGVGLVVLGGAATVGVIVAVATFGVAGGDDAK